MKQDENGVWNEIPFMKIEDIVRHVRLTRQEDMKTYKEKRDYMRRRMARHRIEVLSQGKWREPQFYQSRMLASEFFEAMCEARIITRMGYYATDSKVWWIEQENTLQKIEAVQSSIDIILHRCNDDSLLVKLLYNDNYFNDYDKIMRDAVVLIGQFPKNRRTCVYVDSPREKNTIIQVGHIDMFGDKALRFIKDKHEDL